MLKQFVVTEMVKQAGMILKKEVSIHTTACEAFDVAARRGRSGRVRTINMTTIPRKG